MNEAENIPLLLPRINAALAGRTYEVLVVDDNSKDRTPQVCEELSKTYPLKLMVRTQPKNGLSGAVLHGIAAAAGEYIVVMDADLQHPPESLPKLLEPLEKNQAEFVIGSRYVAGGTTGQKWGLFRMINSRVATLLARPFAGKVADPMSGFFGLRRSTYQRAQRLTPLGYKIGLELMCKCRVSNVQEVPIHFSIREHGESKLTLKQQFKYLEHLSRLYDFVYPRLSPVVKFAFVTVMAWAVGFAIFAGMYYSESPVHIATAVGYLGAILVTAVFHVRYVRTQREFLTRGRPWRDFIFSSVCEWGMCIAAAAYIALRFNDPSIGELFFIPFGVAMTVRYIFRKELLLDVRGLRREIRGEELG